MVQSCPGVFCGSLGGWRTRPQPLQPTLVALSSDAVRDIKTVLAFVLLFGVMFVIAVMSE
jgi:hypothetical protein